jgi:hypothetical protein
MKAYMLSARRSDWVGNLQVALVIMVITIKLVKCRRSYSEEHAMIVALYILSLACLFKEPHIVLQ